MLSKYLKCNVWRLAVRYDVYIYVVRRQRVNSRVKLIRIFHHIGSTSHITLYFSLNSVAAS